MSDETELRIQNLNQMLATAAGRLDVVASMLEEDPLDAHALRAVRRYVTKARDNLDQMIERHNNGERAVK